MKRVGEVLSAIFDEGLMNRARGYSALYSCWEDLAEKNGIAYAAGHSRIKSLDKGLVWIEVDHPGWKQILQTKESKLLSDFRRRFPEMDISGISIVLCRPGELFNETGPESAEEPLPAGKTALPGADAEAVKRADASGYGAIRDGALKDALARLEKSVADKEKTQGSAGK
ncbi:MAG: DUF721 domain-containing protein [Treponema sp.]|nr:DUF721 domain-containing protein [Treponema sp.]